MPHPSPERQRVGLTFTPACLAVALREGRHYYPNNPSRKPKISPDFTAKTKKPPFKPQKPTKPQFSPLNYPSKTVIFPNFSQKSRKSSQKVKKRPIFKPQFRHIPQKNTPKPPTPHPKTIKKPLIFQGLIILSQPKRRSKDDQIPSSEPQSPQ